MVFKSGIGVSREGIVSIYNEIATQTRKFARNDEKGWKLENQLLFSIHH